jgi:hypothetical protein
VTPLSSLAVPLIALSFAARFLAPRGAVMRDLGGWSIARGVMAIVIGAAADVFAPSLPVNVTVSLPPAVAAAV